MTRYTPALTMVLEWSRAETGVGATMAPHSQLWKGVWAALVKPAKQSRPMGSRNRAEAFSAVMSSCRDRGRPWARIKTRAKTKATPPSMFIHRARVAFLTAMSVPSCLISMKEQNVVTSQKK